MATVDPKILAHLEWLGFVQPTGLVVSAPALVRAGAILDRHDATGQQRLRDVIEERVMPAGGEPEPEIPDFELFARHVLGWTFSSKGYAGFDGKPIPEELQVSLTDYGEMLMPDLAVSERDPVDGSIPWELLVRVLDLGDDLDHVPHGAGKLEASAHGRMERLLRETGVPAGLLCNGRVLRLISAPRGESSGWLEFRVADMVQAAGRPICTAMRLLLSEPRLLTLPREKRLAALLNDSRKYQNEVSEKLAEQVLHALYELLRGFQAAHEASGAALLHQPLAHDPDDVYRALLTVILRLVFVLYGEERDMLPQDETFLRYYALAGLYERLREDAALHPDTMDQRYGAWAQLLALFRMINDGACSGSLEMPARQGVLFDPDRYPFLEGRSDAGSSQMPVRIDPPLVSDGTVFRALDKLLVLDGERISYRALDVEQIGSVYETMMGFSLELATGRSVAVKAQSRHGAPSAVDLEALLAVEPGKRAKWLQDRSDRKLTTKLAAAVKEAVSLEDVHYALSSVIDAAATPDLVPSGAMILQPSEERRRSGSHYTPRALTEPIVRTTLEPILDRLRGEGGATPRPADLLELKICDPAMGSGAFLVEACRQLGDVLRDAWNAHGERPEIPSDEDALILARRMIAQRCLYGVDRNPVAVDLAKMSLWLVTLAREHPLTFVDHALRHGDSLVGLSRRQISSFHWKDNAPGLEAIRIGEHVARVAELRAQIREAGQDMADSTVRGMWVEAQAELRQVRLFGDLAVVAFFSGANPKEREMKRSEFALAVTAGDAERYRGLVEEWRAAEAPVVPFHWEIEFPEVSERADGGFDAIIGNPPFLGSVPLSATSKPGYTDWLRLCFSNTGGKADLVAFFFRRAFALIRPGVGVFGLIATNTIRQGDTRESSLVAILREGGQIYAATRRLKWPGNAAVTVSVVHVQSSPTHVVPPVLDGVEVSTITAYLLPFGPSESPLKLTQSCAALLGVKPGSRGFVVGGEGKAGFSAAEIADLVAREPAASELIFPYLSGDDLISGPIPGPRRRIIDFGERSLSDAEAGYSETLAELRSRLNPPDGAVGWYRFARPAKALRAYLSRAVSPQFVCTPETSKWHAMVVLANTCTPSNRVVVFTTGSWAAFGALQAQPHEMWRREFSSTFEDRLTYVASDCFDTFPFPLAWQSDEPLEEAGHAYHTFRSAIMTHAQIGLTDTYNRFHDPYEHDPEIVELRELHAGLDRAVLHAYGWDDISSDCEFLLDYEIDEVEWGTKKKPYRYRWPDEVRDEVLARLIALNAERAAEERRSGRPGAGLGTPPAARLREPTVIVEGLF